MGLVITTVWVVLECGVAWQGVWECVLDDGEIPTVSEATSYRVMQS